MSDIKKIQTIIQTHMRVCDAVLTTSNGVKVPTVRGPVSASDVISEKGYRYKRGFWEKILNRDYVRDSISSRKMLGMIEHPESDEDYLNTPYEKASHVVVAVDIVDSTPLGTFALLNNEYGNKMKALVDLNVPLGVSTRGLGDIVQDDVSPYIEETNYGLITWDFTRNPNFRNLQMQKVSDSLSSSPLFKELIQSYSLRDSVDESYNSINLKRDMLKIQAELTNLINKIR